MTRLNAFCGQCGNDTIQGGLQLREILATHRFFSLNANKSLTSTFRIFANFSKPATDGELTPRSTKLMNSTEQESASASCSWVSFRALRRAAIRWPSFL